MSIESFTKKCRKVDREILFKEMESKGFEIVKSTPLLVLLDIDSEEHLKHAKNLIKIYGKDAYPKIKKVEFSKSKTEGHYHGFIEVEKPLNKETRLLLQLALGSDRKKELVTFKLNEPDSVLFEVKGAKRLEFEF